MTDNEIVKALECCTSKMQCFDCPRFDGNWGMRAFTHCDSKMKSDALDLINRQKAEIERLRDKYECIYQPKAMIKAEIIKEFAERIHNHCTSAELNEYIDSVVEEMVGENDDR